MKKFNILDLLGGGFGWFLKNPIMIAVAILSISTAFFFLQARYHKQQAHNALVRAVGAETALERSKQRDRALKALELQQRQENEEIQKRIAERNYFDSVGGM